MLLGEDGKQRKREKHKDQEVIKVKIFILFLFALYKDSYSFIIGFVAILGGLIWSLQ